MDLAIHKHRPTVQAVLQEAQDKLQKMNIRERSQWQVWQRAAAKSAKQMTSVHAWKLWLGLTDFSDEMDEAPKFPYYYLWFNGLFHILVWYPMVFCPLHNPQKGLMWDFPFWHLMNAMLMLFTLYCLHKTTHTNPGTMVMADEEFKHMPKQHRQVVQYWRKLYETTLESYATTDNMQQAIKDQVSQYFLDVLKYILCFSIHLSNSFNLWTLQPLCHTCHIARPHRSKHCRVARSCVLMFDHQCPFVNATIGLYNYPYFYLFLLGLSLVQLGFIFNLIVFVHRSPKIPWLWLLIGIYHALHIIPAGGMFVYHTQLCMVNLTTNEHMNVGRYDYLMEKSTDSNGNTTRRYRNPWFKGYVGNFLDRMSPNDANYIMPQYCRQVHQQQSSSSAGNKEDDDEEKQQRRALLANYSTDSTAV